MNQQYFDRYTKKSNATVMRHSIEIQAATRTSDGEGGYNTTWETYQTVFASVDPIQARQQFDNRSVGVDATHLFKIRGEIVVNEKDRIYFDGRAFEILTIENINERGILKVITTKEIR